ncbi:MAG: 3-hydroxyacyl-ACP dehydratase [Bacteroidota bacterium]
MSVLIENLYEVKSFENHEGVLLATVSLNKNHEIFEGHFPENPVMPGVCMIQMIKELTETATGKSLFLSTCSNIKFMEIINPEKNPVLGLDIHFAQVENTIKVKSTVTYRDTLALKLNALFQITD